MFFFLFFAFFSFIFFSRRLINGVRSRERFNEVWHCVIHLVVCVTVFFKLKDLFLIISSNG